MMTFNGHDWGHKNRQEDIRNARCYNIGFTLIEKSLMTTH